MKLNRGTFSGKETRNRSIERFQDMQFLPFQQSAKKTRSFFSGFQASEPAAPIATGRNRMEGNEVLCKGAMSDELNLNAYGPRRRIPRTSARLRCNLDIEAVRPR